MRKSNDKILALMQQAAASESHSGDHPAAIALLESLIFWEKIRRRQKRPQKFLLCPPYHESRLLFSPRLSHRSGAEHLPEMRSNLPFRFQKAISRRLQAFTGDEQRKTFRSALDLYLDAGSPWIPFRTFRPNGQFKFPRPLLFFLPFFRFLKIPLTETYHDRKTDD